MALTDPDDAGKRDYHWGDMWHYAIARMVVAACCRFTARGWSLWRYRDQNYKAQAPGSNPGLRGEMGDPPEPDRPRHELFAPSDEEITKAMILEAMEQAQKEGKGRYP